MKAIAFLQPLVHITLCARYRAIGASLAVALVFVACGGGGNDTGAPASSGPDLLSEGAISGFGSVIVNGVRIDDSKAKIEDEDEDTNGVRSKDDLRLGMVVSVSGTSMGSGTGTAVANSISFSSKLRGPLQGIDNIAISNSSSTSSNTGTTTITGTGTVTGTATTITTGTATTTATGTVNTPTGTNTIASSAAGNHMLSILGQPVVVGAWTMFDPISLPMGISSLNKGDIVEVYGHLSPIPNLLVATRISKQSKTDTYKITGIISGLSTEFKLFLINTTAFSYADINPDRLRVTPANGQIVKLQLSPVQTNTGTWSVTDMKPANKTMPDRARAEVEGVITTFNSPSLFRVNGVKVDATNASFPKGTASLVLGVRVEVKGAVVDDTLIASVVKTKQHNRGDDEDNMIELHGSISAVNTSAKTFVLRGLTVSYAGNVRFLIGLADRLVNGASVEVKGQASGGGTTVQATSIKFEN